jgi:MYXO-CTERM domain-containing protein
MILTPGNPMRVVLLSILLFEVVVYGLAIPVMMRVSDVPPGYAIGIGGGAALLALVAAGLLRRPAGYLVGWVTQPVGVALGFLTTPMFFIGAMFLGLWLVSFILGRRLDGQAAAAA